MDEATESAEVNPHGLAWRQPSYRLTEGILFCWLTAGNQCRPPSRGEIPESNTSRQS